MTYPPQQPYGHSPTPDPQAWPPAQIPPSRKPRWPWLVLAVAVLFLVSAGWFAYNRVIKKDSGIAACEAMAGNKQIVDGAKVGADEKLTEAQYRQVRKVFEDSRYDDIKDHGTKLIDVVWQVSQLGDTPGMEVLAFVGPLTTEVSGLQSACADQGIIIKMDLNPSGSPTATGPKCSDVFAEGKTIPKGDGTDTCLDGKGNQTVVFSMDCTDGRKLYQVESDSDAQPGWGFGGGKYKAAKPSNDPKFNDAMTNCNS
jgi:hypothetical protein